MSSQADTDVLLTERADGVLTLTLNRPAVLNAINDELLDALSSELAAAASTDSVRAVVITGSGRAFSSGQDLKGAAVDGRVDVRAHLEQHYHPAIRAIRSLEKPVIAALNGVAAGAGFSLALACDLRLATRSATFVQAFVRIGLIPDAGSTYFLPRLCGLAAATELAMLGESIDAERALRLGLVTRVVEDSVFAAETRTLARRLAAGPRSLGLIKRALNRSFANTIEEQLALEAELQEEATTTADFLEGVGAFLQKREARFSGR